MGIRAIILGAFVFFTPVYADAALLYIDPDSGTHGYGDTFIVSVRVDNEADCINAVKVAVEYPTDRLKAVDFSRGGSILSLWIEEPKIDTEKGTVTFAGGVPGGYCGRIRGDPALSNILGKIVFTVVNADTNSAALDISVASRVYINDGQGSRADVKTKGATFTLATTPLATENPWLKEVEADDIPPDSFDTIVESTRGVFGGRYYLVFATQDKQSGMDHFEIFEHGAWKTVTSPYNLRDQSLTKIQVKAIDKAGNARIGDYTEGSAPPRVRGWIEDIWPFIIVVALILIIGGVKLYINRRLGETEATPTGA